MPLSEVMKGLQEAYQISDAELARETGIPQATIYRLVSGMTDDPKVSSLRPLAGFFNITIGQLMGDEPLPSSLNARSISQNKWNYRLPIISWEQACAWQQTVSKLTNSNWSDWCSTNFPVSASAYALTVPAKKYCDPFRNESVALVEPNIFAEEGDFVAVHFSGMRSVSLRRWILDGGEPWLIPLQKGMTAVKWSGDHHFCGVVIQAYLQLREKII